LGGELGRRRATTAAAGLGSLSCLVHGEQQRRCVGCGSTCPNSRHFPALNVSRPGRGPPPFFATLFVRLPAIECRPGGTRYFCDAYGKRAIKILSVRVRRAIFAAHVYPTVFARLIGPGGEVPEGIDATSLWSGPVQCTRLYLQYITRIYCCSILVIDDITDAHYLHPANVPA